ncbi:MAG: hypothetical protein HOH74_01725, partial [Gemmatimonadetes bacterium]|nr:hypothetical protein [Gemmatimonadota bacterium]
EGYSQKEIAALLDISAAAVKKRLFLARRRLEEKGLAMASVSDDFAINIRLFVALRAGDLSEIKALVLQHPELVSVRTVWGVGADGHYWPLDATPLFWAVATNDEQLFSFLISQGAEVNVADRHGFSPLHTAMQLRRPTLAGLLLERGAVVDSRSSQGQTPLMMAVLRGASDMVTLLLQAGADVSLADNGGLTAGDWARIKGADDVTRLLTEQGAVASAVVSPDMAPPPVYSGLLESGIKIVDLLAPLTRGGHTGLFSPLSGVGVGVLIGQLTQNFIDRYEGHVIYTDIAAGSMTQSSMDLLWRSELGLQEDLLAQRLTSFFAPEGADADERLRTVRTALKSATQLRAAGHEVLHFIDAELASTAGVIEAVRSGADKEAGDAAEGAAVTTIWHGDFTEGLQPPAFAFLDGVITFSRARARQRLYPAVDPLRSWSRRLQETAAENDHSSLAEAARRVLLRYDDLHDQYEYKGFDALFYLDNLEEDRTIVARARRLTRFLTQPFVGVEPYTGRPGIRCSAEQALDGCRRILQGESDSLAEEAFEYQGSYEQVLQATS